MEAPGHFFFVEVLVDDETLLWQRAQQFDSDAFAELFERHRAAVFRQALRVTGHHHDAEEVAALAFAELWRRRAHVRLVGGSVLPWLLTTAFNLSRNSRRAALRHRALIGRLERLAPPEPPAPDASADLELASGLRRALDGLPQRDQRLIALVLVSELPVAEAAAAVGMAERTARNRISLIKRRLRDELRDLHPGSASTTTTRSTP